MNIIVVIFTILKTWIKGIKSNLSTFLLCFVGLFLSLYLYDVYNTVQEQKVLVLGKQLGNAEWENKYSLVYGLPSNDERGMSMGEPGILIERSLTKKDNNRTPITKDSILVNAHNLLVNQRFMGMDSINMDCGWIINVYWNFQDNLWFIPHETDTYEHTSDNLFETEHPSTSTKIIADEVLDDYIHYETMTIEPVTFHNQRWFGKNNWIGGVQCIEVWKDSIEGINSHCYAPIRIGQTYDAHWYSAFDISKLVLDFTFQIRPSSSVKQLSIDFIDLVKAENVYPEPDERYSSSIVYNGADEYGEHFKLYLEFPKKASIQQARNYILSAFITLFFTLLTTISYNIIRIKNKSRRRRISVCTHLCKNNKYTLATKLYYPLLINDIIIVCGSLLPLIIINPFDWGSIRMFKIVLLIIVIILLLISTYYDSNKIAKGINPFLISISKIRIILKGLFVCLLFTLLVDSITGWNILLFILLLLYMTFRFYCYYKLDKVGAKYFYRPVLKQTLWVNIFKVCFKASVTFIVLFEIIKYIVECNLSLGWHTDWSVVNSVEVVLFIVFVISYLCVKTILFRRKK